MCGIVGYISEKEKEYGAEKNHFMRFALALDTLRGQDSTGIMTLRDEFKLNVMHSTLPGDRLVHSKQYDTAWVPGWAQVGHNRAATAGKVNLENAHPFTFGAVTLVHNGTLSDTGYSLPDYDPQIEVDSALIASNLSQVAPDEAKRIIELIDGSFCLVWYDERDKSVNMARNSERPMHYGVGKQRDILWFMSDGAHLHAINSSFGSRTARAAVIYSLTKNQMLKWKKGNLVPEVTKFVPFVPAPASHSYGKQTTALERAVSKWKPPTAASFQRGGASAPRVSIRGELMRVPSPMLKALEQEFELKPEDLLQFTPAKKFVLGNTRMQIIGTVLHPKWGQTEWTAVLYNAKPAQVEAYMKRDWLVRPTGIAHPWEGKNNGSECPTVLCELVHCNWKDYEKRQLELELEAEKEAADEGKALVPANQEWIAGPQSRQVLLSEYQLKLQNGCISCGWALTTKDLPGCTDVNEGRDLLCHSCSEELSNPTIN
jgi:predicted glutamine amidotransferase